MLPTPKVAPLPRDWLRQGFRDFFSSASLGTLRRVSRIDLLVLRPIPSRTTHQTRTFPRWHVRFEAAKLHSWMSPPP